MTSTSDLDPGFFGVETEKTSYLRIADSEVEIGSSLTAEGGEAVKDTNRISFQHNGKRLEFSRLKMVDALKSLKKYKIVRVSDLTGQAKADFADVQEAIASISSNEKLLNMVIEDVKSIFGNASEVLEPGTVGSYMLGCYKDGAEDCDPYCAASLAPYGRKPCGSKVYYVLTSGNIIPISSAENPSWDGSAVVYWGPSIEPIFSKAMLEVIKADGVKSVVNKVLGSNMEHSKLEVKDLVILTPDSSALAMRILLALLVLLILVFIGYVIFRAYSREKETA